MLSFSPSLKVTGQLILARYQPSCQQGKHTVRVSVCLPLGWGDGQAHARGRFNQNWEAVFTKNKEMYLKKKGGESSKLPFGSFCLQNWILPLWPVVSHCFSSLSATIVGSSLLPACWEHLRADALFLSILHHKQPTASVPFCVAYESYLGAEFASPECWG